MKLCVVGNGPSAEGKGKEIDACDFVVRMRDFWHCAAVNAGTRINAHSYFGWWDNCHEDPWKGFEHWFSHCPAQLLGRGENGWRALCFVNERAAGQPIRWLLNSRWDQMRGYLDGAHPSTGFVTITMALDRFVSRPCELVLYGFDSTAPDKPNFFDAREANKAEPYQVQHEILREKRAIYELRNGVWLGQKRDVKLTWPDKPEW